MRELTIIELMDRVLEWFCMTPDKWLKIDDSRENVLGAIVCLSLVQHFPELQTDGNFFLNIDLVLNQLVKDKYISEKDFNGHPAYSIEISGKLFCSEGGYGEQKAMNEKLKNLNFQKLNGDVEKLTNELGDYSTTKWRAKYGFYFSLLTLIIATIMLLIKLTSKNPS